MRELENPPAPQGAAPGLYKALIALVWVIWVFDVTGILYMYSGSSQPSGFLMGVMTMLGLRAWMQVELGRRRKWSRYGLTVFAALGIVVLFADGLDNIFGIGAMIIALTTLYLLYAEPVRVWCTE